MRLMVELKYGKAANTYEYYKKLPITVLRTTLNQATVECRIVKHLVRDEDLVSAMLVLSSSMSAAEKLQFIESTIDILVKYHAMVGSV